MYILTGLNPVDSNHLFVWGWEPDLCYYYYSGHLWARPLLLLLQWPPMSQAFVTIITVATCEPGLCYYYYSGHLWARPLLLLLVSTCEPGLCYYYYSGHLWARPLLLLLQWPPMSQAFVTIITVATCEPGLCYYYYSGHLWARPLLLLLQCPPVRSITEQCVHEYTLIIKFCYYEHHGLSFWILPRTIALQKHTNRVGMDKTIKDVACNLQTMQFIFHWTLPKPRICKK